MRPSLDQDPPQNPLVRSQIFDIVCRDRSTRLQHFADGEKQWIRCQETTRDVSPLAAGNQPGICSFERPDPQPGFPLDHANESHGPAVRRNRKTPSQVARSGKAPAFGRSNLEADDTIISLLAKTRQCPAASEPAEQQRRC